MPHAAQLVYGNAASIKKSKNNPKRRKHTVQGFKPIKHTVLDNFMSALCLYMYCLSTCSNVWCAYSWEEYQQ